MVQLKFENEQEWLKFRKNSIGGSDLGALMEISQYQTISDLAKNKLDTKISYETSSFAEMGKILEEPIFNKFVLAKYPNAIRTSTELPEAFTNEEYPGAHATLDGRTSDRIIEIKFVSTFGTSKWIDIMGNYAVPLDYIYQVQHYMAITGIEKTSVFALFQDLGECKEFEIKANIPMQLLLREKIQHFWGMIEVLAGAEQPVESRKEKAITEELLRDVKEAAEAEKQAKIARENATAKILVKYPEGTELKFNELKGKIVMADLKAGKVKKLRM